MHCRGDDAVDGSNGREKQRSCQASVPEPFCFPTNHAGCYEDMTQFIIDEVHMTKRKDMIAMKLMKHMNYALRCVYSGTVTKNQSKRAIGASLNALREPS